MDSCRTCGGIFHTTANCLDRRGRQESCWACGSFHSLGNCPNQCRVCGSLHSFGNCPSQRYNRQGNGFNGGHTWHDDYSNSYQPNAECDPTYRGFYEPYEGSYFESEYENMQFNYQPQEYQGSFQGNQNEGQYSNMKSKMDLFVAEMRKWSQDVKEQGEADTRRIVALQRQVGLLVDEMNQQEAYKPPSIYMMDYDDEYEATEEMVDNCEVHDDIAVQEPNTEESLPILVFEKVEEEVVEIITTPCSLSLEEPICSPIDYHVPKPFTFIAITSPTPIISSNKVGEEYSSSTNGEGPSKALLNEGKILIMFAHYIEKVGQVLGRRMQGKLASVASNRRKRYKGGLVIRYGCLITFVSYLFVELCGYVH